MTSRRHDREKFRDAFPELYHERPRSRYHRVTFTHGATVYLASTSINFIGNYGKFPNGARLEAYVSTHHSHQDCQGFHVGYGHADRIIDILLAGPA